MLRVRSMLLAVVSLAFAAGTQAQSDVIQQLPSTASLIANYVVVRGQLQDPVRIEWLKQNYDVWLVRPSGQIDVMLTADQLPALQAAGYAFQIEPTLSASVKQLGQRLPKQINGIGGYPCYRTVEESYQRMDQLAALYPGMVRVQDFGDSYLRSINQGGYAMRALIIENINVPGAKAPLLLIGAIHAREYTTAETTLRFAEKLLATYGIDADSTWLLDHRKLVIVPQMNPDGRKRAEAGASWRRNVRPGCATASSIGVDLNRNSTFLWGTNNGSSTSNCSDTYRGTAPASEPEVQALQNLMAQTFVDQRGPNLTDAAPNDATGVFLSLHSYADLVLFPWGAQATDAPNKLGLQTLARKMGFYTQYQVCQPPVSGCLYAASGTSDDQSYGEFGVASMTFELGNQGFFEACSVYENQTVVKILPALKYLLKSARRPYLEPAGPEVVDTEVSSAGNSMVIKARADDGRSYSGFAGTEPLHNIQSVALYLSPPWLAGAAALATQPQDGSFNSPNELISISLPNSPERSLAYLVATDSAGQVGVPTAVWLGDGVFTSGFE